MSNVIPATDCIAWRALLARLGTFDATCLPEYHLAYALRIPGSTPLMWHYEFGGDHLLYPFLLTPVLIGGKPTGYCDISSIYGYTGPAATSSSPDFLQAAWREFDAYAKAQNIIAEFIRFSPFSHTERFAHPLMRPEANRTLAASELPDSEDALLAKLGSKTRNMLRKAEASGFAARELDVNAHLPAFRRLYDDTMCRNNASEFFRYDDAYYERLLMLGKDGLRLFGTFLDGQMVAASMAVAHGGSGLYHLGASLPEYARLGAGNLSLFSMSCGLMHSGVEFINMTGGRTTALDDPLLLFKKSNATGVATFYIGKRIINEYAYRQVQDAWKTHSGCAPDPAKIIFWRH